MGNGSLPDAAHGKGRVTHGEWTVSRSGYSLFFFKKKAACELIEIYGKGLLDLKSPRAWKWQGNGVCDAPVTKTGEEWRMVARPGPGRRGASDG